MSTTSIELIYQTISRAFASLGGFSEIYTADWIGGWYNEWNSKNQQLERVKEPRIQNNIGKVILKKLENVENASQNWFEEAKLHLTITNKYPRIANCFGLTQSPLNGNYMLVMKKFDTNLRNYLQQNHNQLTWKERIRITIEITEALGWIHKYENSVYRDMHSGNILYSQYTDNWCISDFGFCGPVDKSLNSIYGNLPYIAPEVIAGRKYSFSSDIYSIAIIMWEISFGKPPFNNYEHNYYLAMNIINGIRPKIVSGTPLKYKELIKQCWDADPLKRPDDYTLGVKINEINVSYQNMPNELGVDNNNLKVSNLGINYTRHGSFTSKVHQFENFPEPKNATEEEQEVFHSKPYDFSISTNHIDDFNNLNDQNYVDVSKTNSISIDTNNNHKIEKIQPIKRHTITIYDKDDEIYNNPNLHPENDDFEIPDDGF
ncbi:kinase-like domain-containing protein [Rhizophagus irregularis DAOM 181602=DAOM 197198]|nr:kinase-like domain-containing protein [Rhizophagus irregularis DAOM 181602=DAOM 197198]